MFDTVDSDIENQGEGYFASMTDLMVGMLFIFIIMLMAFVLSLRQATSIQQTTTPLQTHTMDIRGEMLETIRDQVAGNGVRVDIDREHGIIHLPEEILFASGKAELTAEGLRNIAVLAAAMRTVLPCYSSGAPASSCPPTADRLEAIVIEGHTDSDAVDPHAWYRSNLGLSAFRAINTFEQLIQTEPTLAHLKNPASEVLFGVGGYGEQRLRVAEHSPADKQLNRRIDLRFLMAAPRSARLAAIESELQRRPPALIPPGLVPHVPSAPATATP